MKEAWNTLTTQYYTRFYNISNAEYLAKDGVISRPVKNKNKEKNKKTHLFTHIKLLR